MGSGAPCQILNPEGVLISLPSWVIGRLRTLNLIERDPKAKRDRISDAIYPLIGFWRHNPEFNPKRTLRAFNPEFACARSKDSGYGNAFLSALGPNKETGLSGLNINREETERLAEDLDHTSDPRTARVISESVANEVVQDIKRKRARMVR